MTYPSDNECQCNVLEISRAFAIGARIPSGIRLAIFDADSNLYSEGVENFHRSDSFLTLTGIFSRFHTGN